MADGDLSMTVAVTVPSGPPVPLTPGRTGSVAEERVGSSQRTSGSAAAPPPGKPAAGVQGKVI